MPIEPVKPDRFKFFDEYSPAELAWHDKKTREQHGPYYHTPAPGFYNEDKAFNQRASDFTKDYMASPGFKRKMDVYDVDQTKKTRDLVNQFNPKTDYEYADLPRLSGAPGATPARIVQYKPDDSGHTRSKITVDPKQVDQLAITMPEGLKAEPHELGHMGMMDLPPSMSAAITERLRPASDSRAERIRAALSHKRSPKEARGDLHELRFYMHEAGVFDATKDIPFTKEHLDTYRKKTGQRHRLFDKVDDENVIWMMNNIAENKPRQQPGMFTGQERYA